jgi:hypothetical protein
MELEELSKKDFEALGCEDVPAKKLRARVFNLEGLGSELALSLRDMLDRFSPNDDGLSDAEIACAKRAREAIRSAKVVLIDYYKSDNLWTLSVVRRFQRWKPKFQNHAHFADVILITTVRDLEAKKTVMEW